MQYTNTQSLETQQQGGVHYGLQNDIQHILQALFLSTPDMFVVPKLYHQYRYLFDSILGGEEREKALPDVCRVRKVYWNMIKARNEVFCGTLEENNEMGGVPQQQQPQQEQQPQSQQPLQQQQQIENNEERIVHILDSIGRNVDSIAGLLLDNDTWIDIRGHSAKSAAKSIFGTSKLQPQTFIKLINIMCRWATSESRYGDWKAYLVASILSTWKDQDKTQGSKVMLQDALIKFLDDEASPPTTRSVTTNENELYSNTTEEEQEESSPTMKKTNSPIIYLFDVLIRVHLFSYQKYLLRLIARGDLEPKRRHVRHIQQFLHHLASFPLLTPAPAYLINQRRVALYGTKNDADSRVEVEFLNKLKHLARLAVAGFDHNDTDCLFGADAKEMTQPVPTDSLDSYQLTFSSDAEIKRNFISCMESTTRYSILDFTSNWLLNEVKRFVVKSIQ